MNYDTLANEEMITKLSAGLTERGFLPQVIATGAEAFEQIKSMILPGASVMNGTSRTLESIGFIEYLKADQHGWKNLHADILAEKDETKQAELRRQSLLSDYYLGSVHAVAESGEMVIASNTGSQLPHLVYTSPNVILVVSTQKITPTLEEAFNRLDQHVIPLEDVRMKGVYGVGTMKSKTLIMHHENPMMGRKIHVLLVKEKLGF